MIEVIVTCLAFVAILCTVNFLYNLKENRKINFHTAFANANVNYKRLLIEASKGVATIFVSTLFGLAALAFLSGSIIILMKVLNWLKNDRWANSICDLSIDLKFEYDLCWYDSVKEVNAGSIYEWFSHTGSPSFILFCISALLFAMLLLIIISISIARGTLNKTAISITIRQTFVGILYISPFWMSFIYLPDPFNILAPCLLIIKQKLPSGTDLYELQVLAKQAVLILARIGTDEDRENVERIKQTFFLGDEAVHGADKDGASAKFLVDTLFHAAEGLSVAAMIVWFVLV